MYVCWKPPSLLHGGGLINYEVSFSILAISDVTLRSRERSWKAGGCGGRAVKKEERLLAALVSRYHGDKRLVQGGSLTGGLWASGHTLTPLLPATLVQVAVRACTEVGWGEWAPPASARTLSAAPDPPTGVVVSSSPRLQSHAVPDSIAGTLDETHAASSGRRNAPAPGQEAARGPQTGGRLAPGEHAGEGEAKRVDGACGGWGGSEDVAGGCGDS